MLLNKQQKNFRGNYEDYLPLWAKISFNQLALYGTHIGHSIKNLTPYSAWMVLGSRQGLCLINMFKFVYMFRGGLFIIQALVRRRSPIWFVNLDQSSQSIIKSSAQECGEYWVNENWIHGLLTNFHRITKAARNTMKTPRIMWTNRQHHLTQNFRNWSLTRYTWPRAVFVSNVLLSYDICQEAMNLRIPTIGIADTNSPQKYVNIIVPGNDESFSSVGFYNNLMSMFILYNKFSMINLWYINKLSSIKPNLLNNIKNTVFNIQRYSELFINQTQVNLNEFVFTSPVSNIKYGMLNHYQDIWKKRGIQRMYNLFTSSKFSNKNLLFDVNSFYNTNQIQLYTLKNIYTYYKKWTNVFKINRKNRRLKVRLNTKKNPKLYKDAWHFLKSGKSHHARILRNQSFNLWKLDIHSSEPEIQQNVTQIYRRYFKKIYLFPKSQVYINRKSGVYNLLSTWFFVQFSTKRVLFSSFFHKSHNKLTGSIKQKRAQLKKLQNTEMRKMKKSNYVNNIINNTSIISTEEENGNNVDPEILFDQIKGIYSWSNSSQNIWYLKVMGLRHSIKKNTILSGKIVTPLNVSSNILTDKSSDQETKHLSVNLPINHNCCIKYVYNEWVITTDISKTNNSNLNSYYYYYNNIVLFKPLSSHIYINSFTGVRVNYIE